MPTPSDSGPGVTEAEESKPQPSTTSTRTPRDLESLSEEFESVEKATRISASVGACEGGEAERRKLPAFELAARASKESFSETAATQNMEEGLDPLDLAKIVEARLRGSEPDQANREAVLGVIGTQGYEEEGLSPLDLAKIVEGRLQDSGLDQCENTTTPKGDNFPPAVETMAQQNHHHDQKLSNIASTTGDTHVAQVDTVQNDGNRGTWNLPRLERSTANRRAQLQPGAYPSGGNFQGTEGNLETAETHNEPISTRPPTIEPENDTSGLAVANLVQDETFPQDLPQAHDCNLENETRSRETRLKQFKTNVLLGVIVLLAVILILVAILVPGKSKNPEEDYEPTATPTEGPSQNPSPAPTSYSEFWLSLFPTTTVTAIINSPTSPQSMAFEWLMEEFDILHNLTEGRVVQRFALATFYFANSKEPWSFSDNWLNHSVHECLWYSGLEDWYFFLAGAEFPLDHISPCEQDPAGYLEEGIWYQGDGLLKHFWMSYNGLMGSGIPPELYLLTELRSLALDEFNLTSTIPEELSGLSNLEYISMFGCGLFGSIPQAIGRLSKLRSINFAWNSLTETIPSSLFSLTNSMQAIGLLENQLTGPVPTELGLLTALGGLALDTNLFTGTIPTELGQVTGLGALLLSNNILSGTIPTEFAVFTDMEILHLEISDLTGTIPRWLGNLTSMESLTLAYNSFTGTVSLFCMVPGRRGDHGTASKTAGNDPCRPFNHHSSWLSMPSPFIAVVIILNEPQLNLLERAHIMHAWIQ
ncbi:Leucine Rich Repeat [Seminavis robusta]|uniref:Leucine Rich Repeat n=1 Tax=Seminavis robusta TaxID=568900 RepID=A0A9N8EMR6_9STRA|nr:Leucine Rich Repeat [Seminavis robusta]|eukprot:Sro1480_g276170.1 Leucine Rich Repeat (761) ;mRNA; f:14298-16834